MKDLLNFYIKKIFYKVSKYSQAGQDLFALELFGNNGTYIDIGSGEPLRGNNTYLLEVYHNWMGFSVDYDKALYDHKWKKCHERKNKIYWNDATVFDYKKALLDNNLNDIDFLSCDIDPQNLTFLALKKVITDCVYPKAIVFETDFYKEKNDYSRLAEKFLLDYEYKIAVKNVYSNLKKNKIFETWFIKKNINFETIAYNKWVKK